MGVGGGRVPLGWPATAAVHRSQWKFIFLMGHISFIVRLDSMLKLIRNYINQNGFAVGTEKTSYHLKSHCKVVPLTELSAT